jgi:cold shock CspA family protein
MEGTIKRIIRDRGFGFIHALDGQEVFFHRTSVLRLDFETLKEGLNVEFEVQRSDKGARASNVRVARP